MGACTTRAPCQSTDPWDTPTVRKSILEAFDTATDKDPLKPRTTTPAFGQPFCHTYIRDILQQAGDPEYKFVDQAATTGVTMGVDKPLPRTRRVFRRKTKWRLPEWEGDLEGAMGNYATVDEAGDIIEEKLHKLAKENRVASTDTLEQMAGGGASDGSGGVAAFKILDEGHRRRVINAIGTEDLLQALAGQHQVPEGATDVITAITSGKEKRQALWMGEVFDKISNKALPLEVCVRSSHPGWGAGGQTSTHPP